MAKGNFDNCLKEILLHEGGFVNHPSLEMIGKLFYVGEWSTQRNLLRKSTAPFRWKVLHFIKRWSLKIQEHMPVASTGASTMPMLADYATHTTSENAMAKICLHRSGIGAEKVNAGNAIAPLMVRADGHFAKAITVKEGAPSCAQFVLRNLANVVLNVAFLIHTMFMTFITQVAKEKTLRSVMLLKALVLKLLRQKSQSAFFCAQTATG